MKTVKNTEVKSVGDIFKVVGGGTPSTAVSKYWNGSIPWVTSADIDDHFTITPRKAITKEAIENSATHLLPKGSIIVVTRVGLGKVGIAHTDLCFSQDSQGLFVDDTICDTKYAAYQLQRNVQIFKHISRGTTINGVTKKQLLNVPFILPALKEQKKIVEEIETQFTRLDAGVAALKRAQANLKRYRAAVLKAACEGKLVPTEVELANAEGRSYETGEQLLQRILAERRAKWEEENKKKGGKKKYVESKGPDVSNLPKLPEGWAWATVGQLGEVKGGKRLPYGHTYSNIQTSYPYIRVVDFTNFGIKQDDLRYLSKETQNKISRYTISKSDIYISIAGTIGLVGIVPDNLDQANLTENAAKITTLVSINRKYLCYWLASSHGISLIANKTIATTQAKLALYRIETIPVPLPPLSEQKRVVEDVERRLSMMEEMGALLNINEKRTITLKSSVLKSFLKV